MESRECPWGLQGSEGWSERDGDLVEILVDFMSRTQVDFCLIPDGDILTLQIIKKGHHNVAFTQVR